MKAEQKELSKFCDEVEAAVAEAQVELQREDDSAAAREEASARAFEDRVQDFARLLPGVSDRILRMVVESGAGVSANVVVESGREGGPLGRCPRGSLYMASDCFGSAEVRGVLELLRTNAFWLRRCPRSFEGVKRFLSAPPAYVRGRGTVCIVALDVSSREGASEEKSAAEAPAVLGLCVAETDWCTRVAVVDIVPTIRGGAVSAGKAIVEAVRRHPRLSFVLQAARATVAMEPRGMAEKVIRSVDPSWFSFDGRC